jgi:hypothetical protein
MGSFTDRLAEARAAQDRSKTLTGDFPEDPPAGTYIGKITKFALSVSREKGRPQLGIQCTITEGESKSMQAREYRGLELDFLVAQTRALIKALGYECPDELFNFEASERENTFVFSKDFQDTCMAIEADEATVRFVFEKQNGQYNKIRILEVLSKPEAQAAVPAEAPADDDLLVRAKAFALAQGVEGVTDEDDLDTVRERCKGYVFWQAGVTAVQLKAAGVEGVDPKDHLSADDQALCEEAGIEYLKPVAAPAPKPAQRAAPKAAAKAAPKSKGKR